MYTSYAFTKLFIVPKICLQFTVWTISIPKNLCVVSTTYQYFCCSYFFTVASLFSLCCPYPCFCSGPSGQLDRRSEPTDRLLSFLALVRKSRYRPDTFTVSSHCGCFEVQESVGHSLGNPRQFWHILFPLVAKEEYGWRVQYTASALSVALQYQSNQALSAEEHFAK